MRATPTPFTRRFVPPPSSPPPPFLLASLPTTLRVSTNDVCKRTQWHSVFFIDIIIFLPLLYFFHPRSIDFTLYVYKLNRWRKRGRKRERFQIGERRKKGMEGNWWNFLCPRWWYGMPIPQCGPKRAAERRDRYQGRHFAM